MAFSSTILDRTCFGDKRIVTGTYDGSGVTTGDITTGLSRVETFMATAVGSSIVADAPTVNETFPTSDGTITLIFTSGTKGNWIAIGL